MIPDQTAVWNKKHSEGEHDSLRNSPSPLAQIVEPIISKKSYVLELGCGVGRDSVFFAKKGHKVIATDSSEVVIKQNKDHFKDSGVDFAVLDMQEPFPYTPESFDMVFANLSLHYYSHQKTREIIEEIHRILKKDGVLAFTCKSVDDFHYGNGEEVEKDIFVSTKGHVRHLFSTAYTKDLLGDLFIVDKLDTVEEEYSQQKSNILRCIAKKSNKTVRGI